jgi:hypothetical protein
MRAEDLAYFERRAEEELALAQRSICPEAVKAHYHLAGLYLDRVYHNSDVRPEPLAA